MRDPVCIRNPSRDPFGKLRAENAGADKERFSITL